MLPLQVRPTLSDQEVIQSNSHGGVQKLAETRDGTFVLRGGSLILADFGPKVVTLCIFFGVLFF